MAFPRIYTSFADFEREELRRFESPGFSIGDLMEERFADDADNQRDENAAPKTRGRRGRPRSRAA